MKDNLEKFIQSNRSQFDSESPGENVWENIEKTIPNKNKSTLFPLSGFARWAAAAAIVIASITAVYFLFSKNNSTQTNPAVGLPIDNYFFINTDDLSGIAPELVSEIKKIFNDLVNSQQELKTAATDHPELYQQFLSDLSVLKNTYNSLNKQLLVTPNRDIIIKAMKQNLLLQSELIYRQIMITREYKQQKINQNEKAI